jgi:hypothetical protein
LLENFKPVFHQIERIQVKIHKQEGFWFFRSHTYTIEELLNSEHHHKIFAMTEKIGDDASRWYKVGKLTEEGKNTYYEQRDSIDDQLHRVNLEIESREPTWWEKVKGAFGKFVEIVNNNLPELFRNALENLANRFRLHAPIRRVLRLPYIQMDDMF